MNRNQQAVIIFAAMVLFAMVLYPPWSEWGVHYSYGFLFDPPQAAPSDESDPLHLRTPSDADRLALNWSRLINQWVLVLVVASPIFWALRKNK
jgi:hypothetical protein